MPGLDPTEVRVAGAGHVFMAPEGTALPEGLEVMPAPWVDLGYVSTDGVTFTFSRETEDLDAWQGDKIRVLTTREPATVAFALIQTNADIMVAAFGGGQVTEVATGEYRYEPVQGENAVRSIVVEFTDENVTYRYLVTRAQVEGDVTFTLTRAGAVTYPLTFGMLGADPKYAIVSNDVAMSGGSLPGTAGEGGGGAATAVVASAEPAIAPDNSIWVDSDDRKVYISDGAAWDDSAQVLDVAPGAVSIGTADPSSGAGLAGAANDAFFQNVGGDHYETWIKGAGAATDWTNAAKDIPLA
jgi:hypothetical protein